MYLRCVDPSASPSAVELNPASMARWVFVLWVLGYCLVGSLVRGFVVRSWHREIVGVRPLRSLSSSDASQVLPTSSAVFADLVNEFKIDQNTEVIDILQLKKSRVDELLQTDDEFREVYNRILSSKTDGQRSVSTSKRTPPVTHKTDKTKAINAKVKVPADRSASLTPARDQVLDTGLTDSHNQRIDAIVKSEDATIGKKEHLTRIQKLLAHAGVSSRRQAEVLMSEGRVRVNGKIEKNVGTKVDIRKDKVTVDHNRVTLPPDLLWVMFHKPKGVLCTVEESNQDRQNIASYVLPAKEQQLRAVGQLERSASGLVLLTNDVENLHKLTHLSFPSQRRYFVSIKGKLTEDQLDSVTKKYKHCKVSVRDYDDRAEVAVLDITIRNAHVSTIHDMLENDLQCNVLSLRRIEFNQLQLGKLKRGDWRTLSLAEVDRLKAFVSTKKVR